MRKLRSGQPSEDFDAEDNCRPYSTTIEAMNFQDDMPSFSFGNFKDHHVLLFDWTSIQDNTDCCHYRKLVGEPLKLELNFAFPVEHVTELIVLGERMSSVAVDKFGLVWKNIWNGHFPPSVNSQSYPATQVSVPWFISLRLWSNSSQWDFCLYKYSVLQYAGWALDNDGELIMMVFCTLSWSWKVKFPGAAL